MPRKRIITHRMIFEIEWFDGHIESTTDKASVIKKRFADFVNYAAEHYLDGIKEVRLLDRPFHVFKSYKQHF